VLAPVKAAANFYPGVRAPAPPGYVQALITALRPHLARPFGAPPDGRAHVTCALSMATLPADQASLAQRLPHIDTTARPSWRSCTICAAPSTAARRSTATAPPASRRSIPRAAEAYLAALRREMAAGPARMDGYIIASSTLYEQTAVVAPGLQPDRGLRQQPAARRRAARPSRQRRSAHSAG
jgi:hypothetical protein